MRVAVRDHLDVREGDVECDIDYPAHGLAVSVMPTSGGEHDRFLTHVGVLDPLDDDAAAWLSGYQSGSATWLALSGGHHTLMPTTEILARVVDAAVDDRFDILRLHPRCLDNLVFDDPLREQIDDSEEQFMGDVITAIATLADHGHEDSADLIDELVTSYLPTWSRHALWHMRPTDPRRPWYQARATWFLDGLTTHAPTVGTVSDSGSSYMVFPSFVQAYRQPVDRSLLDSIPLDMTFAGDALAAIWSLPERTGRFGRYEQGFLSGVTVRLGRGFDPSVQTHMLHTLCGPTNTLHQQPSLRHFLQAAPLPIVERPERRTAYELMRSTLEHTAGTERATATITTLASIDDCLYTPDDRTTLIDTITSR